MTILYVTEYDALGNNQSFTHVKRCMQTADGFVPVADKEDIFFANTAVKDDSDKSELLQLFLRKDVFEDGRYPAICEAVKYFKQTEGGRLEVCKAVEDYARDYAKEYGRDCAKQERLDAICRMIKKIIVKKLYLILAILKASMRRQSEDCLSMPNANFM